MYKPLIFVAFVGLSACSGAAPQISPTLNPASGNLGDTLLKGDVPSGSGQATMTYNGTTIAITKQAGLSLGTYGGASTVSSDGTTFDAVAFTDDGLTTAGQTSIIKASVLGTATSGGQFAQVAYFNRLTKSVLPTVGSGTYTGEYRGTYGAQFGTINGSAVGGLVAVRGTSSLKANFQASTIYGSISARRSIGAGGVTLDNFAKVNLSSISLPTSINANGAFNGTTSGGANSAQTVISISGIYQGLIGGTNGRGIAGGLSLTSNVGGTNYTEIGVFTGLKP